MNEKILEKAMETALKVFIDAGYKICSKNINTNGSLVGLNITAEKQKEAK